MGRITTVVRGGAAVVGKVSVMDDANEFRQAGHYVFW
jgi:hypothetical protein